jgi:Zn-dependent protease
MLGSLELGRPFGIRTTVHPTFWLLPAIVALQGILGPGLDSALFDIGVLFAVFGCVALHELGHALAARRFGIGTQDITLYPIGGVARLERMPRSSWQEIAIALAGPAVNVAIAAVLATILALDGGSLGLLDDGEGVAVFLNRVLWANVGLVLFNLIPAFPMDGGRVFRASAAWFTDRVSATNIAAKLGAVFAVLFAVVGFLSGNFMLVILAFFLWMAGKAEADAVRYEDAYTPRRRSDRVPVAYAIPTANTAYVDGWEYDPARGMWVYWQRGQPVKAVVER